MSVFIALITNSKRYYLIKKRMIFMIQNRSYWTILSQRKREHQRQIPPLIFFYFDWIKRKKNLLNINEGDENNLLAFLSLFILSDTLHSQSSFLLLLSRFLSFFSFFFFLLKTDAYPTTMMLPVTSLTHSSLPILKMN